MQNQLNSHLGLDLDMRVRNNRKHLEHRHIDEEGNVEDAHQCHPEV